MFYNSGRNFPNSKPCWFHKEPIGNSYPRIRVVHLNKLCNYTRGDMSAKQNLEFLSVVCDNIEYRCEQWQQPNQDMRGEPYIETMRSLWVSKDGKELDDAVAIKLLHDKSKNKEKQDLINRLWSPSKGD